MYLYQISGYRYSPKGSMSVTVVVKDDATSIQCEMNEAEIAEFEALGQRVFERHQIALANKMTQPLETNLLAAPAAPVIEDGEFSDAF